MYTIRSLDLHFQKEANTIASFLVSDQNHHVLVETGPESTWPQLVHQLQRHHLRPEDIDAVLLTHIHFDHAGAAWKLAEAGARIYVHPLGLPHLANPEKLWQSAARIYGKDNMQALWGSMEPIESTNLIASSDMEAVLLGKMTFVPVHTPGHAIHHVAWKLDDNLFTGDVAGVKIHSGPVVPPCPPPDIDLEDWKDSIAKIRALEPDRLYLTHYGTVSDISNHFQELERAMDEWAAWMKIRFDDGTAPEVITKDFMAYTEKQLIDQGVGKHLRECYELANPSWMSVSGLLRYWKLKQSRK
ncbi:Glyoxylase, beta-lactamase superfamily II [Cyclobacterium xiamenense]|uniref:Glyoxylase, beta-lactamase superfamily II n=1 Tax=Cyclobacterium xiamenense TaxID=1297121 RepID=A0A1H6YK23_9BACT|nr:MBL fold metallo-hydrolase [Cyclobacterium xiamenense]SEJ40194.1 Glyoxylase, beta-lactamase superfamily II [Cyclobacterium xiamenense]